MNLNGFEITDTEKTDPATVQKSFTPTEANAALPLVKRIVQDIVNQYRLVTDNHNRLKDKSLPEDERREAEAACSAATDMLNSLANELTEIGCELKDWECGLVDFPARQQDREVCLCWKLGEEQVTQWHEVHAGFAGREPITATDHFEA